MANFIGFTEDKVCVIVIYVLNFLCVLDYGVSQLLLREWLGDGGSEGGEEEDGGGSHGVLVWGQGRARKLVGVLTGWDVGVD